MITRRARHDDHLWVHCGGCGRALLTTHHRWHTEKLVPCPCGAGADLEHARRHVSCPICEEDDTE